MDSLASLWGTPAAYFAAMLALIVLADLLGVALGRRMLNPRSLSDRAYAREKRSLAWFRMLDMDATYEPQAVGTLVGHWRAIRAWSGMIGGALGALLTVAITAVVFLYPIPGDLFANTSYVNAQFAHFALAVWLAISSIPLTTSLGESIGSRIATARIPSLPREDTPAIHRPAGGRTSRRWHRLIWLLGGVFVITDLAITLLFRATATAAYRPDTSGLEGFMWLTGLLLAAPVLMALALALGELLAYIASRQRPLVLSADVGLARRANAGWKLHTAWQFRRSMLLFAGFQALVQSQLLTLLFHPPYHDRGIYDTAFLFEMAYLVLFLCYFVTSLIVAGRGSRQPLPMLQ